MKDFFDYRDVLAEAKTNKATFDRPVKFDSTPSRPQKSVDRELYSNSTGSFFVFEKANSPLVKRYVKMAKEVFTSTMHNTSARHRLTVLHLPSAKIHKRIEEKNTNFYLINGYPYALVGRDQRLKKQDILYLAEWLEWHIFHKSNKYFPEVGGNNYAEDYLEGYGEPDAEDGWRKEPIDIGDPGLKNLAMNIEYGYGYGEGALNDEVDNDWLNFKTLQDAWNFATQHYEFRFINVDDAFEEDVRNHLKKYAETEEEKQEIDEAEFNYEMADDCDWNEIDEEGEGDYWYEFETAARDALFKHANLEDFLTQIGEYESQCTESGLEFDIQFKVFEGEGTNLYIFINNEYDNYGYVKTKDPEKVNLKKLGQTIERLSYEKKLEGWP